MPATLPSPYLNSGGFVVDPHSGLSVPPTYAPRVPTEVLQFIDAPLADRWYAEGHGLDRDEDTLIVHWNAKGSGWDDYANAAIVDGRISNVGLSPIISPQLSGMVMRQQRQAIGATIDLTGRSYPTLQARDAIARFNDSPTGASAALQQIVYQICVYNKGAPIATVPITYAVDKWGDFGLEAAPLLRRTKAGTPSKTKTNLFYLRVDWAKFGQPVPFLPSVYDLEPSGIAEWPYWFRTKDPDGHEIWVLLHKTHILEFTPGVSEKRGIGTSAVWMCLGILAEEILILEARAEQQAYGLASGIIVIGGVEGLSGAKIKKNMEEGRKEAATRGIITDKGPTILTSPMADKASIAQINFRQLPVEFKERREYVEDVTTFCFGESLSAMVTRGGVGYGAQAPTAAENTADAGIAAILSMLSQQLGAIYPRVQVSISRPNDRAARLNIGSLKTLSDAVVPLVQQGILDAPTVRIIIGRDILYLPPVTPDTITETGNTDDSTDTSGAKPADQTPTTPVPAKNGGGAQPASNGNGAKAKQGVRIRTERMTPRAQPNRGILYQDAGVEITIKDVDTALELARERVGEDIYGLLTAEPAPE